MGWFYSILIGFGLGCAIGLVIFGSAPYGVIVLTITLAYAIGAGVLLDRYRNMR